VILGIVLRILFTGYFGVRENYDNFWGTTTYTHDTGDHIQYIKFVARNLSLPEVNKGLEYPQQPLYYIITGLSYRLLQNFFNSSDDIFKILIWYSCFFSILSLLFMFLMARKITDSRWLQFFVVGIFAFTPSFVFHSIMISNDPMLTLLSAGAFYFLISYTKSEKSKDIFLSTIFSALASLTKISSGFIFFIIIGFLIYKYGKNKKTEILNIIFAVFLIGFICFGAGLWRAYMPSTNQFRFVESYSWAHQRVYPETFSYLFTFNLSDLLQEAQSHVFGNEKVARTWPTFLYGSSIFGEYEYNNVTSFFPYMRLLMQVILILGLCLPVGLVANFFFIKKWEDTDYIFITAIIINFFMLTLFLFKYSAVCNSDFRYLNSVFIPITIFSGLGLSRIFNKFKGLKSIIPVLCILFISLEFIWVALRIAVKAFAKI
jgi:hypothetical protein